MEGGKVQRGDVDGEVKGDGRGEEEEEDAKTAEREEAPGQVGK